MIGLPAMWRLHDVAASHDIHWSTAHYALPGKEDYIWATVKSHNIE